MTGHVTSRPARRRLALHQAPMGISRRLTTKSAGTVMKTSSPTYGFVRYPSSSNKRSARNTNEVAVASAMPSRDTGFLTVSGIVGIRTKSSGERDYFFRPWRYPTSPSRSSFGSVYTFIGGFRSALAFAAIVGASVIQERMSSADNFEPMPSNAPFLLPTPATE